MKTDQLAIISPKSAIKLATAKTLCSEFNRYEVDFYKIDQEMMWRACQIGEILILKRRDWSREVDSVVNV
jgi:hypothetical protein